MPWNREWQPVSVFLSGKFHGQKSLWGAIAHGTAKSQTQQSLAQSQQLVTHTHTYTHTQIQTYWAFKIGIALNL